MQQLINEIVAKTGITPEQARSAIEITGASLKSKMPHYFHAQIDNLLQGGTLSEGFRKKLEDLKGELESAIKNLGSKAEELSEDLKKSFEKAFDNSKKQKS